MHFTDFEAAARWIRDQHVAMVDLTFCDLWGRWHHVTLPAARFTPQLLERGIGFDGSAVGFKSVKSGDMLLVPDLAAAFPDPFAEAPTLAFICRTFEADEVRELFPHSAREVLERIILERAQLQQAKESGLKVDDYAVSQAEQGVARQNNMSVDDLYRRLARDGMGKERFREELRNQLLLQRLREREVEARVKVTDLDIDQYLREQQKGNDVASMEINLGHVLVLVPENASPVQVAERQARAQRAADKVRAGEDFAAVAREFSDAPEGQRAGGQLGMRPADRYPELFVNSTLGLPVGSIVGPVRSPAGFHVLKVIERVTAGVPTTVVQNHARHILLRTGPQLSESAAAARLADYRRRVQMGQADFAALAREHSQDGSSKEGGDLGWATPGRYVPEFEQALNALKPGDISEPVVSRFGVHLIQLLERREAKLTQREQRDMARDTVREKKLDEAYATWAQELRGRAYVEYRDPPQ